MAKRKTTKKNSSKKTTPEPAPVLEENTGVVETPAPPAEEEVAEETPTSDTTDDATPSKPRRILRTLLALISLSFILVLVTVIAYFIYEYTHIDKAYGGITVAGQNLGGKNYSEAGQMLEDYKADLKNDGLTFTYEDHTLTLPLVDESADASVPLVEILTDSTLHEVFSVGRGENSKTNLKEKIAALLYGQTIPVTATVQSKTLEQLLATEFDQYATPYVDAQLSFTDGEIDVIPHTDGTSFHWADVLAEVDTHIQTLQPLDLTLDLQPSPAPITTSMAEATVPEAQAILELAPLSLNYEDNTYTIEQDELSTWITLTAGTDTATVTLSDETIAESLIPITGEIDIPVQEGRFSLDITDGEVKLQQFQDGQDGLAVQTDKTTAAIKTALLDEHTTTIPLVVEVTKPRANPENLDDLGIKELLGTGTTSFAGSPVNRIGNIQKGADMLNGLLIAPGETFSLLDILKPFDIEHGWLPELVIKGNKLEKEPGGGLCQIGSTAFRAAMMSGLEITERRNHSWAVSYYNYNGKAGVDATIYDPAPDFKFTNDTENYILWRSRIEGSTILFEFWGTSDGRKGYFTEPVNYGYTSPGPTEETVDPTLPPGSRTCAQHAYGGVTASFDYIIDRANGQQDKRNFTSVYKAQPERCVVGPEAEPEPEPEPTEETPDDTTDDTNSNSNTNSGNTNNSNKGNKNKNKN